MQENPKAITEEKPKFLPGMIKRGKRSQEALP